MCGFSGVLLRDRAREVPLSMLERMTSVIAHRGPDACGLFRDGPVGLGHRRLSIIDLSSGQQPMSVAGGRFTIVFNGEIYNFRELAKELSAQGYQFQTTSDTEVILALYERSGPRCVDSLRGMFAFAIWDKLERTLFIARDRVGIKPLYYAHGPHGLVFGSELKAVMASGWIDDDLDFQAVDDFLAHAFIRAPRTIFRAVAKLEAGCHLLARFDGPCSLSISTQRYWSLPSCSPDTQLRIDEQEAREELERLLMESVRLRLIAEVPLGAFLSGGIDSSTVVWLMSRAQAEPVRTFSIGFQEDDYDERRYARAIAERFGTRHEEEVVTPDALDVLPRVMAAHDEPFGDPSSIPTYYVCQMARKHVTVCLSGDGGDELFAGYKRYRRIANELEWTSKASPSLRRIAAGVAQRFVGPMSPSRSFVERLAMDAESHYARYRAIVPEQTRRQLYDPELCGRIDFAQTSRLFANIPFETARHGTRLDAILASDFTVYLPDDILVKVDRMSMAHSLEARVPLLDHKVVEFVSRLPLSMKLSGLTTKKLLRDLVRPHLPPSVLAHRKQGFSVPLATWFRGPLKPLLQSAVYDGVLERAGLSRGDTLVQLYKAHMAGQRDYSWQLWQFLMLNEWLRSTAKGLSKAGA